MTGSLQSPLLSRSSSRLTAIARHLRTKHKVVVCRDLGTEALAVLRERDDLDVIVWPEDRKCERSWLLENVSGATGLIVMFGEPVDEELLNKAGPSLKVVSTMSVGYEHVSLPALSKRGVRLGYTPDVLTDAVADIAVMLALMASRNVKATTGLVHEGQWTNYTWSPFGFCGPQISSSLLPNIAAPSSSDLSTSPERTVGFLGFGRIAQATLARLIAFGVRRCIYTGNPSSTSSPGSSARDDALAASLSLPAGSIARVSLEDLAARADVLFLLAPGGRATHHIVDEAFLRHMKRTAVLVNPARGTLVDSNALARALRDGWIWGAGLDVVEGEPQVGKEHPLVKEPRCVVLPHIGSATFETRTAMATLAARNAIAGVLGEEMPMELDLAGRS